jgi:hypothetical protein
LIYFLHDEPEPRERGTSQQIRSRVRREIAAALGATKKRAGSNECVLNGEAISIKCAKVDTDRVGVYTSVLSRIRAVLGGFETVTNGPYDVYRLSKDQFRTTWL